MRRAVLLSLVCLGCGKSAPPGPAAATASTTAATATMAPSARPPTPRESASAAPATTAAAPSAAGSAARGGGKLKLDAKPVDVATGSRAMLFRGGVVVRKRGGDLAIAKLGDKPGRVDDEGTTFARTRTAIAESPTGSFAVWIEAGALVRRRLVTDGGEVPPREVLVSDAEEYAPAATMAGETLVVAYVAKKSGRDDDRRARVWVDGRGISDLSGDSGASTLSLLRRDDTRVLASWVDQRTALAPIHLAEIDLSGGKVAVTAPTVAWNAPPADGLLELALVPQRPHPFAFVAGPKNGADFGLAGVLLEPGARPRDDARWIDYPNGLDPAPVVGVQFCGRPGVVFAKPTGKPIDAPKVLVHAWVDEKGALGDELELARAQRFDHADAWSSPTGGWVLYAGDGRTLVRRLRCAP